MHEGQQAMTIHLMPEQDAALAAVEQRTVPGFAGTQEELDALLAEGLTSKELTEDEFWRSVNKQTDSLLADHKPGLRS